MTVATPKADERAARDRKAALNWFESIDDSSDDDSSEDTDSVDFTKRKPSLLRDRERAATTTATAPPSSKGKR